MNLKELILIGSFKTEKGYKVREYMKSPFPKRADVITDETHEQKINRIRLEYQSLSVFEKAERHEELKKMCEDQGIDFWLIICDNSAFDYLTSIDSLKHFS